MSYQKLSQVDLDFPQLTQEIDEKEVDVEYIYEDSSDENDKGIGITYESDSSVDILEKVTTNTVIVDNYENYFKENDCRDNCRKNQVIQKLALYGVISILAIAIVIVVSLRHLRKPSYDVLKGFHSQNSRPSITLEDVLEGRTFPRGFNGTWESDDRIIYRDRLGNVILFNVHNNESTVLIPHDRKPLSEGVTFSLSFDGKFLLVARNLRKRFRRSYSAIYDILNLETNNVTPLLVNNAQRSLYLAKWSPYSNAIIFNYKYDLYYKPSLDAPERRITFDGSPHIYNGIADWVYEEEVFSSSTATWFNANGNYVAFIKFNETNVISVDLPIYGHPEDDVDYQYPARRYIHYPKVGSPNPMVSLIVVNLVDLQSESIILSSPNEVTDDHILASVAWSSNETLVSIWMNRIQNFAMIRRCNVQTMTCYDVVTLKSGTGWLDLFMEPLFNEDGTQMAIITSQDGFRHLTMISTTDSNSTQVALTHGNYVVTKILKWDSSSNIIFYTANMANSSESQHIYVIKATIGATPQCLTCRMTFEFNEKPQQYFDAEFSKSGHYMILSVKGPDVPKNYLTSWSMDSLSRVELHNVRVWEENHRLQQIYNQKSTPSIEYHEIPITGHPFTAKVLLQVPHDIDRSGKIKYPMLVDVYGGPNFAAVTKKFNLDWGSYLTSNLSIIYARIDGRGSGLRGDAILHQVYKRLGSVEIQDQINTAKKLSKQLPYIDSSRMAIWGWSYGGYVSGLALTKDDQKIFKCAASVAPVTDWMYYDSIYTERYMDLPENNLKGYLDSRLSTNVDGFRGKQYLLIHGTLDDNVHLQQSMALVRKLEKSNIQFKEVSYPDEDHSLAGVRPHLYQTLTNFFMTCFDIKEL